MKVMVNGVEIEIKGSSRLTYDVDEDTLSVDPIIREKRKYNKKGDKSAIEKIRNMKSAHEILHTELTMDELKEKVVSIIRDGDQPVAQQFITMECIGKGAKDADRRYFKTLLQQMSESGEIILSRGESGRARYSIP